VPAKPTYVFATRSLRDAQAALTGVVNQAALAQVLGVDPLNPETLASIGVDVDAGMAIFSAAIDPTLVLHLSSPPAMQQFIDQQRIKGQVSSELRVDWKVEGDWAWVHLAFAPHGDTTDWYAASTQGGTPTWGARWDAAQKLATAAGSLVGIIDLQAWTAQMATRVTEFAACAKQFETVRGVGFAIEAEGKRVAGKITVDVGGSAQTIAASTLAPTAGLGASVGTRTTRRAMESRSAYRRSVGAAVRRLAGGGWPGPARDARSIRRAECARLRAHARSRRQVRHRCRRARSHPRALRQLAARSDSDAQQVRAQSRVRRIQGQASVGAVRRDRRLRPR
jgi:hypothetical protein